MAKVISSDIRSQDTVRRNLEIIIRQEISRLTENGLQGEYVIQALENVLSDEKAFKKSRDIDARSY